MDIFISSIRCILLPLALGIMLALAAHMRVSEAARCVINPVNVNLGSVDSMLTNDIAVSAAMTMTCAGLYKTPVYYCLTLSPAYPAADAYAGIANHRILWRDGMRGQGASRLPFNFRTADNKIWGSPAGSLGNYGSPITGSVMRDESYVTYNLPFTAIIGRGSGTETAAGNYENTFLVRLNYNYINKNVSDPSRLCSAAAAPDWTISQASYITVTAAVKPACHITVTQNISFTKGISLSAIAPAAGQIRAACSGGTLYAIGLNKGNHAAEGGSRRAMKCETGNSCGESKVYYDLYQDAAHTRIWGDDWNTGDVVRDAFPYSEGGSKTYNVYAQLYPGQGRVPSGTYSDIVVISVQVTARF